MPSYAAYTATARPAGPHKKKITGEAEGRKREEEKKGKEKGKRASLWFLINFPFCPDYDRISAGTRRDFRPEPALETYTR